MMAAPQRRPTPREIKLAVAVRQTLNLLDQWEMQEWGNRPKPDPDQDTPPNRWLDEHMKLLLRISTILRTATGDTHD